jgi:glucose/mannose-6-phosphate isomerase
MNDLDKPENYAKIDQNNLLKNVSEFPAQCEQAWEEIQKVVFPSYYVSVGKVVILGMGGSAIGGDVVKDFVSEKCNIPIEVIRDYKLPAYVNKDTLVLASSYSGNTEETLEAFQQALFKKAKTVVITTNGEISKIAKSQKIPLYQFNYNTEPRQAFGFSFSAVLGILNKLALIDIQDEEFKETITHLKGLYSQIQPTVSTSSNQAKKLAEQLYNKIVIILGAGYLKSVGKRFKTQLNENAKQLSFWEELPEACHNFVVGLEFPEKIAQDIFVLSLASKFDHPRNRLRQNIIFDILNKHGIPYEELRVDHASTELSEILSFIYLLDFTSYYLAILNKTDPRPVSNINYLKDRLKETPWRK